ncbi:MAG: RNase P subunit p30 family protein [Nanoarchaeota archaeon]
MQLVEKDKIKSKYPLVFSSGKETNVRAVVEKKKPQIITNLAFQQKDFMHHRAGINQVVAQAMHDNDVALGLSLPLLFSTKYKPEVMGRIMQNIVLARKHKVAVKAFTLANHPMNMRSPKDLISLLVLLGMDHKEAKSALRLR